MKEINRIFCTVLAAFTLLMACGCATSSQSPPPLTYVAVERPTGPIKGTRQNIDKVKHPKGGWYFLNYGLWPASDIGAYLDQAQINAGSNVLQNVDVECNSPFVLGGGLLGFQVGGADFVHVK